MTVVRSWNKVVTCCSTVSQDLAIFNLFMTCQYQRQGQITETAVEVIRVTLSLGLCTKASFIHTSEYALKVNCIVLLIVSMYAVRLNE